jgi:NADH dehydrogenase
LKRCDAEIVLIDQRNHHIFQPLLYQVATAVLAPSEIAAPMRQPRCWHSQASID